MYFVFTCMPGESYHRSLLLCLCDIFQAQIISLVCWFWTSTLGLVLFQIMYIYKLWGHCFHILFRIYFIKHAFLVRSQGQFFCFQKHLLAVFVLLLFFLSLLALAWNAHWYCDLWAAWVVEHGSNQMIRLKWKNSSHSGTYLFVWLLGHFSFTFLHPF